MNGHTTVKTISLLWSVKMVVAAAVLQQQIASECIFATFIHLSSESEILRVALK